MKFIDTKTHGILDYLIGFLLIASPWILQLNPNSAESWVPVILGIAAILYNLITKYESGVTDIISMRTHLVLNIVSGVILASSPWIFGFSRVVYIPHLVTGLFEIAAAMLSKTTLQNEGKSNNHHRHTKVIMH